ncbi:MAG: dephospho-CoA kinase, partial [Myxococcota bacterium]|nr:dephospho-CoA kinase [Myxococcota bacterium]
MNPQAEGPRLVGLTGGLASGKSTVASLLRALGAEVVDADEVAREVAQPGRPAYRQIVATFGPEVVA